MPKSFENLENYQVNFCSVLVFNESLPGNVQAESCGD